MIIALLLAIAPTATIFDCEVESPLNVIRDGEKLNSGRIGLNPARNWQWKFSLSIQKEEKSGWNASIEWPSDPVGAAGVFPAVPTGNRSFAIITYDEGPCLFTETSCATVVQFVERPDGSARVSLLPSAMVGDFKEDTRRPMHILMDGSCAARKAIK